MKKKFIAIVMLGCIVLLSGCITSPKTKMHGKIMDQPWEYQSASDTDLSDFSVEAERSTNGNAKVTIKIGKASRHMNPDVIAAQGAAQAQLLTAVTGLVSASAQQAQAIAGIVGPAVATGGASLIPKAVSTKAP